MYLNDDLLNVIKESIFRDNVEICANMSVTHTGSVTFDNLTTGIVIDGREACMLKYNTSLMFHTHPHTTYAYPSFEDINKVSKHIYINISVVATIWGIWQINRLDMEQVELNKHKILPILNDLGLATKDYTDSSYKSLTWSDNVRKNILKYISHLNKYLNYHNRSISFTSWEDIENSHVYFL